MTPRDNNVPASADVEAQLNRICASRTFRLAPQLGKLLTLLVKRGARMDEHKVGVRIFRRQRNWVPLNDSIVRSNMTNLRKRLAKYYKTEGDEDAVIIGLQPGTGYEPSFKWNTLAVVTPYLKRGIALLHTLAPQNVRVALKEFDFVIALQEDCATAYAAKSEALCTLAMYDYQTDPRKVLPEARRAAEMAQELAPDMWYAHAAIAIVRLFRREWGLPSIPVRLWVCALAPSSVL
jgi:hypothetical protein